MKKKAILIQVVILYSAFSLAFAQERIMYKQIDTTRLFMEVHYSANLDQTARYPAMVFYFGGGWKGGTIAQFEPHAEYFSKRGLVCFLVDYRVNSRQLTTPFES